MIIVDDIEFSYQEQPVYGIRDGFLGRTRGDMVGLRIHGTCHVSDIEQLRDHPIELVSARSWRRKEELLTQLDYGLFALDHVGEDADARKLAHARNGLEEMWQEASAIQRTAYASRASLLREAMGLHSGFHLKPELRPSPDGQIWPQSPTGVPQHFRVRTMERTLPALAAQSLTPDIPTREHVLRRVDMGIRLSEQQWVRWFGWEFAL